MPVKWVSDGFYLFSIWEPAADAYSRLVVISWQKVVADLREECFEHTDIKPHCFVWILLEINGLQSQFRPKEPIVSVQKYVWPDLCGRRNLPSCQLQQVVCLSKGKEHPIWTSLFKILNLLRSGWLLTFKTSLPEECWAELLTSVDDISCRAATTKHTDAQCKSWETAVKLMLKWEDKTVGTSLMGANKQLLWNKGLLCPAHAEHLTVNTLAVHSWFILQKGYAHITMYFRVMPV